MTWEQLAPVVGVRRWCTTLKICDNSLGEKYLFYIVDSDYIYSFTLVVEDVPPQKVPCTKCKTRQSEVLDVV